VENINENNEIPDESDLLSDYNSRARNKNLSEQFSNQPMSNGNIPFANLTRSHIQQLLKSQFQEKKFTKDALIGKQTNNDQTDISKQHTQLNQKRTYANEKTTNNLYEQKKFSADQVGDMSLSTYAWEWAPYINALKRKLYSVWFTPAAYHRLGLIYGYTVIQFQISVNGHLVGFEVLEHNGHKSLEQSSINAINSVFPFKPLPANFPEEILTITARLIYPNLRRRE
jgi:outer membrane biosynthesis protein TonB